MRLQINGEQFVESDKLSLEQLQSLKMEIDDAIDLIEHQLDMAKANRVQTGEFADPQWFAKASFALKRKRKVAQRLQELLGARRKADNVKRREWAEYFVDVCKEQLDRQQFTTFSAWAEDRRLAAIREAERN